MKASDKVCISQIHANHIKYMYLEYQIHSYIFLNIDTHEVYFHIHVNPLKYNVLKQIIANLDSIYLRFMYLNASDTCI